MLAPIVVSFVGQEKIPYIWCISHALAMFISAWFCIYHTFMTGKHGEALKNSTIMTEHADISLIYHHLQLLAKATIRFSHQAFNGW